MFLMIKAFSTKAATVSSFLGAAVMLACALLTVFDVILRNFFKSGLLGMVDLTQLAMVWAAFLTIPLAFATDSHIAVDIFVSRIGASVMRFLKLFAVVAAVFVLAFCVWWGWVEASRQIGYGDRSMTIGIPAIWYWIPLILGCSLSALCAVTSLISTRRATSAAH
jgi:TRAP-type C4-dicarboxylate transport system permease small subunit